MTLRYPLPQDEVWEIADGALWKKEILLLCADKAILRHIKADLTNRYVDLLINAAADCEVIMDFL